MLEKITSLQSATSVLFLCFLGTSTVISEKVAFGRELDVAQGACISDLPDALLSCQFWETKILKAYQPITAKSIFRLKICGSEIKSGAKKIF